MSIEAVPNTGSILDETKRYLGLTSDYTPFDTQIIICINGAIMTLNQLGIGTAGFEVTDNSQLWSALAENIGDIQQVKNYICLKTRMLFDPPVAGYTTNAYNDVLKEYEWRLMAQSEDLARSLSLEEDTD